MFIVVEDGSVSSVVSLGVPGLVALLVTTHKITDSVASVPFAVTYIFPGVISVFLIDLCFGSTICVLK